MTGRTVLITGVASGIGCASAVLFKSAGWRVIGIDKREPSSTLGLDAFYTANVGIEADVNKVFDEIVKATHRVEVLVNNAAIQICKPLIETTTDEWDDVMATNVRSAFLMVKSACPFMKVDGGAIVNVSSVHAVATSLNIAAYAASKGALLSLTRALALELAPAIRVNAVLPGAIDTPMLTAGLERGHAAQEETDEIVRRLGERHALQRIGQPEEIAQAILFLADKESSSFITGQSFVIDGGALARLSTE